MNFKPLIKACYPLLLMAVLFIALLLVSPREQPGSFYAGAQISQPETSGAGGPGEALAAYPSPGRVASTQLAEQGMDVLAPEISEQAILYVALALAGTVSLGTIALFYKKKQPSP